MKDVIIPIKTPNTVNLSDITDSLVDINLLKLKVQLDINLNVQEAIEQFKEFENRIIKGLKV